jgi:hypothetical protein
MAPSHLGPRRALPLHMSRRYRPIPYKRTGDAYPAHLHRNNFELSNVWGKHRRGA